MAKDPQTVTIYGRLSFPVWTYEQALVRNAQKPNKQYIKKPEDVAPEFNLLVEQPQMDKLVTHIRDEFIPFCAAREAAGEKRNKLDAKQIKKIEAVLADLEDQPPHIPIKPVPEKTQALAPECVAMVKINGMKGVDIDLKAIVQTEDELEVPMPDLVIPPRGIVLPLKQTVHQMYAGCYVAATINLYAYESQGLPGITASASTAVFKADGDRFGGGVAVDEDEIFAD